MKTGQGGKKKTQDSRPVEAGAPAALVRQHGKKRLTADPEAAGFFDRHKKKMQILGLAQ